MSEKCPSCYLNLNPVGDKAHWIVPPYNEELSPDIYMFTHYYCRHCKQGFYEDEEGELQDE